MAPLFMAAGSKEEKVFTCLAKAFIVSPAARMSASVAVFQFLPASQRTGPSVSAESFVNLMCGLYDSSGTYLDSALIQSIDFRAESLTLLTPLAHPGAVAQIVFGSLRARPDGKELGELRLA